MVLAAGTVTSSAADRTWNAGGDQSSWSDAANWGGTAPVANDSLFFGGSAGLTPNNNLAANTVFNGLTFSSGAGAFTLSGNQVNLGGGVTNSSATAQAISLTLGLNSANRDFVTVGDLTVATVSGSSGKPRVVKSGAGTLTLGGTADNSYGSTTVNEGLEILAKTSSSSVHALGGDCTVNTNGTLRIAGTGGDQIFNRVGLRIDGKLQVHSNETILVLWGTNGTGIVENGLADTTNVLVLQNYNKPRGNYNGQVRDGAAGVLAIDVTGGDQIVQRFSGTNTYTGPTRVYTTSAGYSRLIMNGVHTGGGDYSVYGNAAANTAYLSGNGIISASKVEVGAYGFLSPGGTFASESGGSALSDTAAILTFSNAVNLTAATSTLEVQLNGTTAGSGYDQVNIAGSGTFSNNAANLKLTLGFTPAAGDKFTIVQVQGTDPANNIGTFATLNGVATALTHGATFVDSGTGKSFQISYHAEGSTFDAGANGNDIMLQVVTPAGGANLTWRGNGSNNNWDITTTADWWNGTSLVTFTNGDFVTFDSTGSNNIPLNLAGDLAPTTLNINATKDYILAGSGKLTGTVVLTKTNSGTLALVTDNDYVGTTLIQAGTLQLGTNGTTGSITVAATVNAGGTLAYNRSDDIVITNAAFNGGGTVAHKGSGKMTIAANVTSPGYTGTTVVSGGELQMGDGSGMVGSLGGKVSIGQTNVLRYYHNSTGGNSTVGNSLAGNGTVIYDYPGIIYHTYTIPTTIGSSNFTGTNILKANVKLDVPSDGVGYALGNGGVVDVTASGCQFSSGRTTLVPFTYNQTFLVSGQGWSGNYPYTGALNLYRTGISGPVILMGDTRINIAGVVISGQISGSYQLEIVGATNGYPNDALTLNPTNGVNSYGSTVVAQGFVRAQNSGALSTGALAVSGDARVNVEGCTITVANLQNANNMSSVLGGGFICNGSGTTNGTLIVGTDGTSTAFDGVFGNGSSRALNLIKVGVGTLTLSGVSTNTGAVTVNAGTLALTGSGSFDNATNIAVASGATLDVNSRGDSTLTLTANQTLKHSGAPVGPINITGNLNMGSGVLLLALNRANAPASNDTLVVSGTLTPGGTLAVTNLGPVLQAGDSFQLFSSGVSGFAYNLQTTDAANNVIYTWNNTVSTDGKITVASVAPMVNTNAPHVQVSVTGNTLHLAWPTNAGWTLLTNSVGLEASGQWFPYPNSANLTNVDITMDPAKKNVFFKMAYPYP